MGPLVNCAINKTSQVKGDFHTGLQEFIRVEFTVSIRLGVCTVEVAAINHIVSRREVGFSVGDESMVSHARSFIIDLRDGCINPSPCFFFSHKGFIAGTRYTLGEPTSITTAKPLVNPCSSAAATAKTNSTPFLACIL